MTKLAHRKKRPSLQSIYVHHIIWGCVCLILLALLIGLWFSTRSLDQKTVALERKLATLSTASCTARDPWQAGTTKKFTIETNGVDRSFLVHLPSDFRPTQYYPALMFFPGKGSNAIGGEQSTNLNSLPGILIYPEPTVGHDFMYSWQGAPYSSGADDVAFVSDILDKVEAQLCVQRSRVYAAGLSNGGGMVSLLSCRLSDRFAAFGIVAGAMYYPEGSCKPSHPTPILSVHGDNDGTVPYFGSTQRRLPAIDSWIAMRARDNGCDQHPQVTFNLATTISTWQNCKNNATVKNLRVHNAGHVWAADAPATLWQFFSAHSL